MMHIAHPRKKNGDMFIETLVRGTSLAFLWDHRVNGKCLMPGTGNMEFMRAFAQSVLAEASNFMVPAIGNVSIRVPLEMPDAHEVKNVKKDPLGVAIKCAMNLRQSKIQVQSLTNKRAPAYVAGDVSQLANAFTYDGDTTSHSTSTACLTGILTQYAFTYVNTDGVMLGLARYRV